MGDRLFLLPNGDWVEPNSITALRIRDRRPNTATGEVMCVLFIDMGPTKFFTIDFNNKRDAEQCRNEIATLCNRPIERHTLDRRQAADFIAGLGVSQHAAPDDLEVPNEADH